MLSDVKELLLKNPDCIVQVLECYGFAHISMRSTEIRCGVEECSNPNSVCIKLINNPHLIVKDYGRNLVYDLFTYIIKLRRQSFINILNTVKQILGITDFYSCTQHKVFGGFYDRIKKQDNSLYIKTYDKSVLNNYELRANQRFLKDGIDIKTQEKFGVRYDIESQRIVIPIYDTYGNLIGVKGRANWDIDDVESKYLYLIPCAMSQTLYGYHINYDKLFGNDIYLLEAEKSVMQGSSFNVYNCVSIGSNSLSVQQCKLLMELNPKSVTFMLDKGLEDVVLQRNIKTLSAFCRMRDTVIQYWDTSDTTIPDKSSPTDLGKVKFDEIVQTQLKEVCI